MLLPLLLAAALPAQPLWQDGFENRSSATVETSSGWTTSRHGGVDAAAEFDSSQAAEGRSSVRLTSRSGLAPNVWLSLSSETKLECAPESEIVLRFQARGARAGRAFVALVFAPAGGESRLYLPQGDFAWKTFEHAVQLPPGARSVKVRVGLESQTDSLWLDGFSLTPPAHPHSNLSAQWTSRPHQKVFPQAPPPAESLVCLDVSKLSGGEQMLATTFQGIVNRTQPRIYLFHDARDRFWADWLEKQKFVTSFREVPGLRELLAAFPKEATGVIVYGEDLPASRHAAVMLGSIEDLPATDRATASKFGLTVKQDLKGRWKRNVDAYREIWTNYRGKLATHVLAVHHPAMERQGPRDYFAQQRVFTFWVSGYAENEPGSDPAAEMEFAHEVLAQSPPNIPIMGWWSYGDDRGIPEYDAVRLSSSYAKFLAGSEFCTNLSVLSGIRVPPETFRQRAPATLTSSTPEPVLYASLSVLDSGDSQWYWQQYQPDLWTDPARGRTAINWSLNPTVLDVMPPVLSWFYQQAAPNDLFFCAISGLGYMNPRVYASRFRPEDRDKIWAGYVSELGRYMHELDLGVLGLYAGSWGESRAGMHQVYERFASGLPDLQAILSDFGRHDDTKPENAIETAGQKPVFHTLMRWLPWIKQDQLTSQLELQQRSVDFTAREFTDNAPAARPALMSGLILSWTMSPALVERTAAKLPGDVRLVNAAQLAALWRERGTSRAPLKP